MGIAGKYQAHWNMLLQESYSDKNRDIRNCFVECTIKGQAETSTNFGVLHGRNFKSIQLAQPLSVHILDDISLSCLFRESQSVCYVHKDNIL